MNKRNGVRAVHCKLTRTGSNDVGLVLLVQCLAVFVVLIVRKYTSKDRMELGDARKERSRELWGFSYRSLIR